MPHRLQDDEKQENRIIEALLNSAPEQIADFLEEAHPADLLDAIRAYPGDKLFLLSKLPESVIAHIIDEALDEEKYALLALFPETLQEKIVSEMSSDELVDLLGTITPDKANGILVKIPQEDAKEVKELLAYDPSTAGGIMATEFISIKETMTVGQTLKYLQEAAPEAETAYYIYVLDEEEYLKGVVSLRDIVINSFSVQISEIMHEKVISVPVDMDREDVGHLFEKYGFLTMPVIDSTGKMLGIVTVDDIMEILRDETTEDMYRLAGLQEGERITGTVKDSVKKRLPWLFVNLLTAILAAATVSLFEGTIAKAVTLAAFAYRGGNGRQYRNPNSDYYCAGNCLRRINAAQRQKSIA